MEAVMATRASLGVGIIGSTAKAVIWVALMTLALGAVGDYAFAQQPAPAQDDKVLSKSELSALVGKIALYPDDLVAIVLPASTYPLQVVEAERFLQERQKDPSLKPSDKWDDSIVALLNYPEVVKLMNNDLDWTWKLGDAVINQRGDLLDAIQSFRTEAAAAGNLKTDEHQVVQNDDQGEVSIAPADPQVVYVPYYDPQQVVVQQPTPVYYYYPYGYPLYYYPYPYGYSFAAGYFWGVTTAFVIGWHSHYVHVVHCGYPGHPYYGHTYYDGHYAHGGYYVRHDANAAVSIAIRTRAERRAAITVPTEVRAIARAFTTMAAAVTRMATTGTAMAAAMTAMLVTATATTAVMTVMPTTATRAMATATVIAATATATTALAAATATTGTPATAMATVMATTATPAMAMATVMATTATPAMAMATVMATAATPAMAMATVMATTATPAMAMATVMATTATPATAMAMGVTASERTARATG
jgi:hypothetical protein